MLRDMRACDEQDLGWSVRMWGTIAFGLWVGCEDYLATHLAACLRKRSARAGGLCAEQLVALDELVSRFGCGARADARVEALLRWIERSRRFPRVRDKLHKRFAEVKATWRRCCIGNKAGYRSMSAVHSDELARLRTKVKYDPWWRSAAWGPLSSRNARANRQFRELLVPWVESNGRCPRRRRDGEPAESRAWRLLRKLEVCDTGLPKNVRRRLREWRKRDYDVLHAAYKQQVADLDAFIETHERCPVEFRVCNTPEEVHELGLATFVRKSRDDILLRHQDSLHLIHLARDRKAALLLGPPWRPYGFGSRNTHFVVAKLPVTIRVATLFCNACGGLDS